MSLDSDGLGRVVELSKRTSYPASRGSISEEAVMERLEGDDVVTMIIVQWLAWLSWERACSLAEFTQDKLAL